MSTAAPHLPERAAIDAYGNGGFRFADMSHQGSLLILPSGMYSWSPRDAGALSQGDFQAVWSEAADIGFLLLGTGDEQIWPNRDIEREFVHKGVALEVMQTGAAVRTYNVLIAEQRPVAAALIAVDSHRLRQ